MNGGKQMRQTQIVRAIAQAERMTRLQIADALHRLSSELAPFAPMLHDDKTNGPQVLAAHHALCAVVLSIRNQELGDKD